MKKGAEVYSFKSSISLNRGSLNRVSGVPDFFFGLWPTMFFCICSWSLPLKPIKIPVFYYKAKQHIPHTFIFEQDDTHIWGLPELEYPGLAKVFFKK